MKKSLIGVVSVLSFTFTAPIASAQMHMGGSGPGTLCVPAECFAKIEAGVDLYFNQLLDNYNFTAQEKADAEAAIQAEAASAAQDPVILYTADELVVAYKLRFLFKYDSRFVSMEPGGMPDGLRSLWFTRYDNLTNWPARGLL